MKEIKAFKCDFCKKILRSKSGMYLHENKCFYNPDSKSCVTCENLSLENCLNKVPLTEYQKMVWSYKVNGTYHEEWDTSTDGDGFDSNVLNDEFKYLYDCEPESYCDAFECVLNRLKTNCEKHCIKKQPHEKS